MKRIVVFVALGTSMALAGPTLAEEQDHAARHASAATSPPSAEAPAAPVVEGVVRKVDKTAGKVTLKHGPIPNLGMPDMLMVFRVQDPAMLDELRAGDKVRFSADKINGAYTVTRLERLE